MLLKIKNTTDIYFLIPYRTPENHFSDKSVLGYLFAILLIVKSRVFIES